LNIYNKAKSVTPAEKKACQASELPQGHTSFEEQIHNGTQDFIAPVEQWCSLGFPPTPSSTRDAALKSLFFVYFHVSSEIGNHGHSFSLPSRPSQFKLTPIGFFVVEEIFILTQKSITEYG